MKSSNLLKLSALGLSIFLAAAAHADTLGSTTVNATDSVYSVGPYAGTIGGATSPTAIMITPGATSVTFSVSTGATVTVNSGGNFNDADGVGSASAEFNSGLGSLSGINAPTAGYIAGVFLTAAGPSGAAPTTLDFTGAGGTSFTSLDPTNDQVFFIGDGLTGDASGATQTFVIPTGATELFLGLADACGYNGGPSCLSDNSGSFAVNFDEAGAAVTPPPPSAVPEPSSLILLGTGILSSAGMLRRRLTA